MWMRVDDGLHAHRKTRGVTKSHEDKRRDAAPMGLWVLAGSWSGRNNQDGWVPVDELDRFDDDWEPLAARLVESGFWWPEQRNDEDGYGFNDWGEWNNPTGPSASGTFGNHVRWHVNKGVVKDDCEHCPTEPMSTEDEETIAPISGASRPDDRPDIAPESGGESLRDDRPESLTRARPDPTRTRPTNISSAIDIADPTPTTVVEIRQDVEQVCEHLATAIEANGSKRPEVTAKWRTAARLMLDKDGRSIEEIHGAIEWSQRDEFWRANILSFPTLREKFDQLRLQAQRAPKGIANRSEEWKSMQERQMERAIEREREMGIR